MGNDWQLIFLVWVFGLVPQIVFGSLIIKSVGKKLTDGGWAWGRLVSWLVVSLVIWFIGHLQMPMNTIVGIRVVAGLLLAGSSWLVIRDRKVIRKILWEKKWLILAEEILFAGGLFWLTWVRGHNPAILDLEKFMDAGFIQGYLRSPTLPAMDMWLAGEKINYYTFGHFMGAVLTQLWGVDVAYAYNLLLGVIMGLTMTLTFSTTVNLIGKSRKTILGGVVAAILMGFSGNTHPIWYFLKNHNWQGYWYADATRFIYNTIHEFPAYSFVVSDLHGHLWDLPIVLMYLGLLILWYQERRFWQSVGMGALIGVMAMTNTWDVLIYGMLTGVSGVFVAAKHRDLYSVLKAAVVIGATAVIVAMPFALNFVDIGQGVRLVTLRSPIRQLAVLWSGHLIVTVIALWLAFRTKSLMVISMVISAVILLIIPELVYVKDIYPEHPRANTMFKLTYQAFVMMTILIGWVIANLKGKSLIVNLILSAVVALIVGGMMTFPYFAYRDYYGSLKYYKSLDGLSWMARETPDDFMAILWLKKNIQGRPVILETVGESYTQHGRFSVFTGLPTVLGWRVHEWLWRGSFEIPGKRTEEVREIYEKPDSALTKELIGRYQIKYIVVGKMEGENYDVAEKSLEKMGEVVFESGGTKIISPAR